MKTMTITAQQLAEIREKSSVELIDVRTPAEFREVHVAGARNIPLDRLDPATLLQSGDDFSEKTLYVLCQTGSRATRACEKLSAAGLTGVIQVEGGTNACMAVGLPIVRGKKTISLERQVRIAAGLLVVLGVLLGWLAHPGFFALAAFVGAGLVFAGVTDTCGMALMLARMPWNQADGARCAE